MTSARSMAAGVSNAKLKSLKPKYARSVDFIAYEVIEPRMKPSNQMKFLEKIGMNTVYYDIYENIDLTMLDEIFNNRKQESKYEIDGIIVSNDSKYKYITSGNPPYSFAYKGMTDTADTRVVDVIWRESKDGILVPKIQYNPIKLSQATMEFTHGFNARYIVENNIGPGAVITMIRSGEVIPFVLAVVKPAKQPGLPTDIEFIWDKNRVNILVKDADSNKMVKIQRLTKFVRQIGVENLSEGLITRLVENGYDTMLKIVDISQDELLSLDGFKTRLAEKIYTNIQNALENITLLKLMASSNIFGRGFGVERKIKKILDEIPDIVDNYRKDLFDYYYDEIIVIDGFEDKTTVYFLNNLPKFQIFYKKMKERIKIKKHTNTKKKNGLFQNEIIVFTGFRNDEWKSSIEK